MNVAQMVPSGPARALGGAPPQPQADDGSGGFLQVYVGPETAERPVVRDPADADGEVDTDAADGDPDLSKVASDGVPPLPEAWSIFTSRIAVACPTAKTGGSLVERAIPPAGPQPGAATPVTDRMSPDAEALGGTGGTGRGKAPVNAPGDLQPVAEAGLTGALVLDGGKDAPALVPPETASGLGALNSAPNTAPGHAPTGSDAATPAPGFASDAIATQAPGLPASALPSGTSPATAAPLASVSSLTASPQPEPSDADAMQSLATIAPVPDRNGAARPANAALGAADVPVAGLSPAPAQTTRSSALPSPLSRTGRAEAAWFGRLALVEVGAPSASLAVPPSFAVPPVAPPGSPSVEAAAPTDPPVLPLSTDPAAGRADRAQDPRVSALAAGALPDGNPEPPAGMPSVRGAAATPAPAPNHSDTPSGPTADIARAVGMAMFPGLAPPPSVTPNPPDAVVTPDLLATLPGTEAAPPGLAFGPEGLAAAALATSAALQSPSALRDLAQDIVQASAGPERQVEIVLAPEELGRLRIAFVTEGDVLRIVVSADRPETLDLLRRNAEQLMQELRDAGIGGATLSFAQSNHHPQPDRHRAEPAGISGDKAEGAVPATRQPIPISHRAPTSATLDLRL